MDEKLSRREREIMDILYAQGELTAAQVRLAMQGEPADATVRTLLRILVQKGTIRQRTVGKRFLYRTKRSKQGAAKQALRKVLEIFYGGSVEKALAVHLSDPKVRLDAASKDRLIEMIENAAEREQES